MQRKLTTEPCGETLSWWCKGDVGNMPPSPLTTVRHGDLRDVGVLIIFAPSPSPLSSASSRAALNHCGQPLHVASSLPVPCATLWGTLWSVRPQRPKQTGQRRVELPELGADFTRPPG